MLLAFLTTPYLTLFSRFGMHLLGVLVRFASWKRLVLAAGQRAASMEFAQYDRLLFLQRGEVAGSLDS